MSGKDQRRTTTSGPGSSSGQPQQYKQQQQRRQNHQPSLAGTQTDERAPPQDQYSPIITTTVVATQTRATLPPFASYINDQNQRLYGPQNQVLFQQNSNTYLNDPNQRQIYGPQNQNGYQQGGTTSPTAATASPRPDQGQNTRMRSSMPQNIVIDVIDYEQPAVQQSARYKNTRDFGTMSPSVEPEVAEPYSKQQFLYGDNFEQLGKELDEMMLDKYQQQRKQQQDPSGQSQMSEVAPGLECLYDVDHFFIQPAHIEDFGDPPLEDLKNKYDVLDSRAQRVYYVGEFWNATRNSNLCTITPKFSLKMFDYKKTEVMTVEGRWGSSEMRIGTDLLGFVEQLPQCCVRFPTFLVKDEVGIILYKLTHEIGSDEAYSYELKDATNGEVIGRVSKIWSGLDVNESSLAYSYGINFPMDTPPDKKVLLLSALFLLYFKFVADPFREMRAEKCAWIGMMCAFFFILVLIVGFSFLAAYLFTDVLN